MLFPFPGLVFGARGPFASADASARSRRFRGAVRRYHSPEEVRRAMAEAGLLQVDQPVLFEYRIEHAGGRVVSGIVGEAPVAELVPHEEVRRRLTPAAPVEIRPLLAISRAPLPRLAPRGEPVTVTESWRRHSVIPVAPPDGAVDLGPLVLADGHHRSQAVAQTFGPGARTMTMVVGDAGRSLEVGSFHRRFARAASLPPRAGEVFEVEPTKRTTPDEGALIWVEGGGRRYLLRPRLRAVAGIPSNLRRSGAAVAARLLYPLVDVTEEAARYFATARGALSRLAPGEGVVLLPPTAMESVLTAALEGAPFPPKATRFRPKPLRGVVLRLTFPRSGPPSSTGGRR